MSYTALIRVGAALLVLLVGISEAEARRPVQLGFVYILSGAFAAYGEAARQGALLAVEEINRRGGIDGRLVITWFENSRSRPDVAARALKKLVMERGVDGLIGIDSSKVARHIAPIVAGLETPLIITNAATPDVTGLRCNRYLFRVSPNLAQTARAAARLAADSGVRTWTTVGKDHPYSTQSWEYFSDYLKTLRPQAKTLPAEKAVWIPSRQKDFTRYFQALLAQDADGVLVTLWGGYLRRFIKQADAMGLFSGKRRFLLTMGASLDTLTGLGARMPDGLWVGAPYWFLAGDSARNRRFVADFHARFHQFPSHQAYGAYGAV